MIRGLIIGHRDIASALAAAVNSITGQDSDIEFLSNNGLSTSELSATIKKSANNSDEYIIIFVDVFGGSCWRAAKQARLSNSHILSGCNLPMLLSFVNKRESYSFDELPAILEHDGKRGVVLE